MVNLEKIDDSKVVLEIEVPEEKVADALTQAYRKVVKTVSIPGFRKGKVPRPILESRFGVEILYEDALELLVPDAYDSAVEEVGIVALDKPEIDLVRIEKGKSLIFKATVEVTPEVTLGEYRGVAVTKQLREVAETDLENKLTQLQTQHATLEIVEDSTAENGDIVVIDFTGYQDDEPFAGGAAEGYSIEIGSGQFIPGFEEQMIGMKQGEEKEVEVTFPEDYQEESLAGKPAVFKVKVNEIKRKNLPELDDELAKEISEFDTLAELKEDIMNKLKQKEEERAQTEVENELIEKVSAATAEFPLPKVLVEREIDRQLSEMEQFLRMQGLTLDKFLELTNRELAELREEQKPEAEKRVKANLVLDAIITKEGIIATDEELDERVDKFAASYGQDVQTIKSYFAAQGQLDVIRQEIQFRKAIDFLVAAAQITPTAAPIQTEA
ncbi:MAG TPA: trigger factor [Oscillospiraceae bacterium]|nr:trigger factor [Oscillospiraceae bacterium]